jgi:H-type small acid-soluble spore protein
MQAKRAKSILKSTKEVEVHYSNNPVWIKNVDEETATAQIKVLGSGEEFVVPVSKLHEL